jgi:hypothetical protein
VSKPHDGAAQRRCGVSELVTLCNPVTGFTCKMPVELPNIIQWAQSKGYEIVSEIQEPTQPTAEQLESVEYWRNLCQQKSQSYIKRTEEYMAEFEEARRLAIKLGRAETALNNILDDRAFSTQGASSINVLRDLIADMKALARNYFEPTDDGGAA